MNTTKKTRGLLSRLLAEPAMEDLDLDAPQTTTAARALIQSKPFLRRVYDDWYARLSAALPSSGGPVLELGSGGGFLPTVAGGVIASDIQPLPHVDVVIDAGRLPFRSGTLRGIAMTNVLHHLPDSAAFFADAARCLAPGAAIVMIEPWVTPWSRWIYGSFHHEPFDPDAASWSMTAGQPLSMANGALPWIIFHRDRRLFDQKFPELEVVEVRPLMPIVYLLSGGLSMRALLPGWLYPCCAWFDRALVSVMPWTAMFAQIVVRRRPV